MVLTTEASVLSAVVSGTLKIVTNKLTPLLVKEYSSIVGVTEDLRELHGQVAEINSWLETVGHKAVESGSSFNWLKKLKEVTYAVDDVIDEFQLETERYDAEGGKHIVSKYLCAKPKLFIFRCNVAHKIKAIKMGFATVVKERNDLNAIANSLPISHLALHTNKTTRNIASLPIVDESSVFGRDKEKHWIISKLVEPNEKQKIEIVCVSGIGGSGKATLAKLVFNDDIIEKHFEVRLWVHVPDKFDAERLVEMLFEAIAGEKSELYPLQQMSKMIVDKLTGKRFLLVLENFWVQNQWFWDPITAHLKNGTSGSKILLTTRSAHFAYELDLPTYVFNLELLSEADSWKMFEHSFGTALKDLDFEFLEVGKQIVKKCGGVPLAIKVLAGVLHDKKWVEEWHTVRDSNLHVWDQLVFSFLELSYSHLPLHLKKCFTLCSVFPRGHMIDKEKLIDQWIAHDMMTVEDNVEYLENSGNRCFNYLVQMSFLQNVVEHYDGRVECSMHDMVHYFAIDVPWVTTNATKKFRYFSITEEPINHLSKNMFEKARAIYVAKCDYLMFGKALKNARHLRTITVGSVHTTSVPATILQIKNLRCLFISGAKVEKLPEAISDLWSLQVLHADFSNLRELPKSIGKLQKLRAINLSYCGELKSLPNSIGDCRMISRVNLHCCKKLATLPNSMVRNRNLRVLRLGHTKIERLPTGITTLGNLECLDLQWCHELVELPEGIGNLLKLEVLNLERCGGCSQKKLQQEGWGKLGSMPVGIGQLTRLQKLGLFVVGEGETSAPISELGNIGRISGELRISGIAHGMNQDHSHWACIEQKTNLQTLKLTWGRNGAVNTENELAVLDGLEPPSGIQNLEIDGYAGKQFARWMLRQVGSIVQELSCFPCLTVMKLSDFPNLKYLQGLMELPCLEELSLADMPFLESISGGPFPSLVKLLMRGMPILREVGMVEARNLTDGNEGGECSKHSPHNMGQVQISSRLSYLTIEECPKLKVSPFLPASLEDLCLERSNEQLLLLLGQSLDSSWSSGDAGLPPAFYSFSHLKNLVLYDMKVTSLSSESGFGCEWEALQQLTSLEFLCIYNCPILQLPERLGDVRSLQRLRIEGCPGLRSLPQSLEHLTSHSRSLKYYFALPSTNCLNVWGNYPLYAY